MIRATQFIIFGLIILFGAYYLNKTDEELVNNESMEDNISRSTASKNEETVLESAIKNKEIPPELSRSLEMATSLLNEQTSDFPRDLEADLPNIEDEFKSSIYPNDLKKRYILLLELSNLINMDPPNDNQVRRIRALLKNELMRSNFSEVEPLTPKENKLKQNFLATAFQLHIQLQKNIDKSLLDAVEIIKFQKDPKIRTVLLQNYLSMNPSKAQEIMNWTQESLKTSPPREDITE